MKNPENHLPVSINVHPRTKKSNFEHIILIHIFNYMITIRNHSGMVLKTSPNIKLFVCGFDLSSSLVIL